LQIGQKLPRNFGLHFFAGAGTSKRAPAVREMTEGGVATAVMAGTKKPETRERTRGSARRNWSSNFRGFRVQSQTSFQITIRGSHDLGFVTMPSDGANAAVQSVGKYDLLQKIAEGGMGTVYKGRNRETGEIVAIKLLAAHMIGNQVLLKRFEQEYNTARQLTHPNIVKALDYGNAGNPYLVMEYVDGLSLGQKIDRDGRMPEKEAIRLIAHVAQGLYRAHKAKLIHRDVKPDNILITQDGQAKLTDLGLVKEVDTNLDLTRTGRGLGTPHFMAPEQFKNAKNVDARSDIYSLGATLYMMVTGEMPFKSSGPLDAYMKKIENRITPARELVPELSDRVDWAIRRAMSADPEQRPTSCREFVEDLTGRSTRRPPPTAAPAAAQDIWYLTYKDEEGTSHMVKGSTQGIRRALKDHLLGDATNIKASRSKTSGFEPLRAYPEFRDLIVVPVLSAPGTATGPDRAPAKGKGKAVSPVDPTVQSPSLKKTRAVAAAGKKDKKERRLWPWLVGSLLLLMALAVAVWYFFFS
jgi:serine/threonine protein kinase